QQVRDLYGRRAALAASTFWTMSVWITGAAEVWIALKALGVRSGYAESYVFESMTQGIRSVLFMIPGALGVQEGTYLVVGELLGYSPETALALALIRRVRELAFGIPGIVIWQWLEGRRLWSGRSAAASADRQPSERGEAVQCGQ